jgi:hypothetical protein
MRFSRELIELNKLECYSVNYSDNKFYKNVTMKHILVRLEETIHVFEVRL